MNKRWTDEELRQLEDPDQWDWEHAVWVTPSEKPGAAVLVRFNHEEFELINEGAERLQQKLTEFVREAALDRARQPGEPGRPIPEKASAKRPRKPTGGS